MDGSSFSSGQVLSSLTRRLDSNPAAKSRACHDSLNESSPASTLLFEMQLVQIVYNENIFLNTFLPVDWSLTVSDVSVFN
jgi:hypothetical protein